jgi:hypothetical protein
LVAQALDKPPEWVLRVAGLLPAREDGDEAVEEIVHYYGRMTPAAREHFRVIARVLAGGVKETI